MTITDLLSQCRQSGVKLWVEEGRLRFRAPSGALGPEMKSELSRRKKELIGLLERSGLPGDHNRSKPEIVQRPEQIPLSYGQERLWFLWQWEPNSPVYNIAAPVCLEGDLQIEALRQSLMDIVDRHEILRTVFASEGRMGVQIVQPQAEVALPLHDMTSFDIDERRDLLFRAMMEEARRPFDLVSGPVFRAKLWRMAPQEHWLLCSMHHIVADGWSIGVIIREIAALYRARVLGQDAGLPPLPWQYADFACWQRGTLQGEALKSHLDFWRQYLADSDGKLDLPADFPRPPRQTFAGAKREILCDEALTGALNRLSRREGLTLQMTLLTTFNLFLALYTGQRDIIVGMPIAGRHRGELEPLIGFFVNTLMVRTKFNDGASFRELAQKVKASLLEAWEHQDAPFEHLIDALAVKRDSSAPPLCQAVFAMGMAPRLKSQLPNLSVSLQEIDNGTAKFDLTLNLRETSEGLRGWLEYNTDLFRKATVERMARHYLHLLEQVSREPEKRISEISLLSASEEREIITKWGARMKAFDESSSLPELFERQVKSRPEAVAVCCEGEILTYRRLDELSNQVAHRLRRMGVGPEVTVGLSTARRLSFIIGLIGVLKAGGTYVPLDPAAPAARLRRLMLDAGVKALIAESSLLDQLSPADGAVLRLDEMETWTNEPVDPLTRDVHPDQLAYIIYTSGSTGQPKGVGISHRNVARLFAATEDVFQFDEKDVWTLFHSGAFDFSVWEIWGALLYGGRLVVVPYLISRSVESFFTLLVEEGVTTLNQTPSAFKHLSRFATQPRQPRLTSLRHVIFGGEALEFSSLRDWVAEYGDQRPRLENMYGITETTVHVTLKTLTEAEIRARSGSLIGRQISDLSLYLLDANLNLAAPGTVGEIHVGGAGLGRGYWQNPTLTAQKLIPHPWAGSPGERLYRSGDLGRLLEEGGVQYLGRKDQQVKIRGFRIELGEIEDVLHQHSGVAHAAVLALEEGDKSKKLVAYVAPRPEAPLTAGALRSFLHERLPDYMIPAAIIFLDELPLTVNNKLDYKALPAPGPERPELEADYVAPRTDLEKTLADIWAGVLGVEKVGINDSFFDLGGDSILSLQVIAEARERGLSLTLQELFARPVIADLASMLAGKTTQLEPESVCLEPFDLISLADRERAPSGVEDAYPLSRLQAGMLFHSLYSYADIPYQNTTSLHLEGECRPELLRASLEEVFRNHPALRTAFNLTDYEEPLQLIYRDVPTPLTIEDLSSLGPAEQEERLAQWFRQERQRRFELQQPPLIRFSLHLRGQNSFQLSWTEHHAILDGWSVAVLMAEIFERYQALRENGEPPPSIPPASGGAFVSLERKSLLSEDTRAFWRRKLEDFVYNEVPRLGGRAASPRTSKGAFTVTIEPQLIASLHKLAAQIEAPLKSVLLAAHCYVISAISGQTDVLTGLVSHGRLEVEGTERQLGLFLNTLPLRWRSLAGSWSELIAKTFDLERELIPHRRFPLMEIQRMVNDGRPLFETLFNFLHFHVYETIESRSGFRLLDSQTASHTNFKLATTFWQDSQGALSLHLEFDPRRVVWADVQEISRYYRRVLQAMVDQPEGLAQDFSVLSPEETRQILRGWNPLPEPLSPPACLHWMLSEVVRRQPLAIALEEGERHLTYQELERLADQVARYLRIQGVGPEVPVGVLLPPSIELVIALYGILKAGGVYVPMDPGMPDERLSFICSDARLRVVLTWPEHGGRDCLRDLVCAFLPEDGWIQTDFPLQAEPGPEAQPSNAAYIIYTSGSTGRPKGVCVEHRAAVWHLQAVAKRFDLTSADKVLQFASPSFDVSLEQALAPLLSGARVVPRGRKTPGPDELNEYIDRHALTVVNLPPQYFLIWTEQLTLQTPASLRSIIIGGDALSPEAARRWQALPEPRPRLLNAYGPTETVITATVWNIPGEWREVDQGEPLLIGRIFGQRRAYALNGRGLPVPCGVPGELYLGGRSLARGYWRRPELTAERFAPDPLAALAGAVMYRTGDMVRSWRNDELEFLGRTDRQVKLRGYRIELGEIESALQQHPDVREAVVSLMPNSAGENVLVSHLTLRTAASGEQIRQFLKDRLPGYMVPSAFVVLDSFPLTVSGKIDRRALPRPSLIEEAAALEESAPPTLTEELVGTIWGRVLKVAIPSPNANFFALGGHSLTAAQVMSWVRKVFKQDLPLGLLFEHPVLSDFARALERAGTAVGDARPEIEPLARHESLPLSFAQQRFWFLDRLRPQSAAYNMPFAVRLQGPLNVTALREALTSVAQRHESLRTRFTAVDGEPQVLIDPPREVHFNCHSFIQSSGGFLEEEVRERLIRDVSEPFDLEEGPLFRVTLYQLGAEDHVLLLNMHHIIADGWSLRILLRELAAFYSGSVERRPVTLAALPIQYVDYAAWQRKWLSGKVLEEHLAYWRSQLEGSPAVLSLPADRPRPPVPSSAGAEVSATATEELTGALKALSRQEGATLFMALLAAWQVLLTRYCDQQSISVGIPVANRWCESIENLIGLFVDTVVVRAEFEGDPSMDGVLEQVRHLCLEAFSHQDLPFDVLVGALNIPRDFESHPLFQVSFALQSFPPSDLELSGLTATPLPVEVAEVKFDLSLNAVERGGRLRFALQYRLDMFEAATAERMLQHYLNVLARMTERPRQRLSEIVYLSPAEMSQLLVRPVKVMDDPETLLHRLFERQAALMPDATAVIYEGEALSYRGLDALADRLAALLEERGVGPDVLVGLFMERGMAMVIATIGILKAGGGYMPIDTQLPADRLSLLLNQAQPALVLATSVEAARWPETASPLLILDIEAVRAEQSESPALRRTVQPENVAYVIHTSGSTGTPEGVMISHAAICNHMLWLRDEFSFSPDERVLLKALSTFDLSVQEFWSPFVAGGTLVLARPGAHWDSDYIARAVQDEQVTILEVVPSQLRMLLEEPGLGECRSLRRLICGGEDLPTELVAQLQAKLQIEVGIIYGPTETTINATFWTSSQQLPSAEVTIGRPIHNLETYVLDRFHQLAPAGVPGDLYLGGIGLAHGYWRDPQLTATSFVPNPYSMRPGERLYRTGDLAKRLPDGQRLFLGRRDGQVKVRGHRKPSGKRDSQSLPAVKAKERRITGVSDPPRDLLEWRLVRIWEELLHLHSVGVRDNFFEIGGTSLLGLRLISRIRNSLGKEVSLEQLWRWQTIETLARSMRAEGLANEETALVTLQGAGSRPPFFCVHPIGGSVSAYMELARFMGPEQPFHGLQAVTRRDQELSVADLAAIYAAEIEKSRPPKPYWLGGWSFGGIVALEMARRLTAEGRAIAGVVLIDSYLPDSLEGALESDPWRLFLADMARLLRLDASIFSQEQWARNSRGDEELLALLREQAVNAGTLPSDITLVDLQQRYYIFRANALALKRYRPDRYEGKAILIQSQSARSAPAAAKWRQVLRGDLSLHSLPGDHYSILAEPLVRDLAALLERALKQI